MSILELLGNRKNLTTSFKITKPGIHFLLSFSNLGFYYCFFGSLSRLPLMSAIAIYLAYPLFIPYILRMWMGRKFKALYAFGVYLAWLGILLTFDPKFKLNNILVIVATLSSLLKAFSWIGYQRLSLDQSPILTWIIKYFTATIAAALLLAPSIKLPPASILLMILIGCMFEKISFYAFKKSLREDNQLKMIMLFNSSVFLLGALDLLIFHQTIPLKPLMSAILIYFGIFFTFKQKNILPNSVYDL